MNEPGGLHAELGRQGRRRRPVDGDLQQGDAAARRCTCSWPRTSSAGSWSRRSTRSGCCGAGATATTGSASSSRSRVAAIATPIQMVVGDTLARWVYNNEPTKFAAIELVPKTASDVPETLFGHLNDDGDGERRDPDPGPRVDALGPDRRHEHGDPGPRRVPGGRAADDAQVNTVHLAWDVMVGLGTLLFLLSALVRRRRGCSGATCRRASCSSGSPPCAGVAVGDRDGGGLGRHRGRPPAVDRAATT